MKLTLSFHFTGTDELLFSAEHEKYSRGRMLGGKSREPALAELGLMANM